MTHDVRIEELGQHRMESEHRLRARLDANCETGLYKIRFHVLHDVVDVFNYF